MALTQVPVGTYANVTGVVNATAAPEIVTLIATFKTFITVQTSSAPGAMPSPDSMRIDPDTAERLGLELDAMAAAIAAAPTV